MGVQEVNLDAHPFKCNKCAAVTVHTLLRTYECADVPDSPPEVWLVECQRCFEQRIIYPADRVASKEDDITRCSECGNWKMKAAKCRVCRLAAGQEKIKERYWTGGATLERYADI